MYDHLEGPFSPLHLGLGKDSREERISTVVVMVEKCSTYIFLRSHWITKHQRNGISRVPCPCLGTSIQVERIMQSYTIGSINQKNEIKNSKLTDNPFQHRRRLSSAFKFRHNKHPSFPQPQIRCHVIITESSLYFY